MITDQQRAELKAKIDSLVYAGTKWQAATALMFSRQGEAVEETRDAIRRATEFDRQRIEIKQWIDKEL